MFRRSCFFREGFFTCLSGVEIYRWGKSDRFFFGKPSAVLQQPSFKSAGGGAVRFSHRKSVRTVSLGISPLFSGCAASLFERGGGGNCENSRLNRDFPTSLPRRIANSANQPTNSTAAAAGCEAQFMADSSKKNVGQWVAAQPFQKSALFPPLLHARAAAFFHRANIGDIGTAES